MAHRSRQHTCKSEQSSKPLTRKTLPTPGYGNDSSNPHPIEWHSFQMSTSDSDPRQRPEGELIRVQERSAKRCERRIDLPQNSLSPNGAMHLIVVDMRGYLDGGGHKNAYRQIAYGAQDAIVNREWVGEFWQGPSGKREPIKGLFEASNTRPAAQLIQERIHFLGFINERQYREGEIRNIDPNIMHYFANPYLFSTEAKEEEAFASYPLRAKLTDA